ncbi:MAG: hypothetical protein OIN83_02805 [Candidatus Methanoperedens sp.]|nr:hypothetical protein [Candidatus Methanoperedens sp.]
MFDKIRSILIILIILFFTGVSQADMGEDALKINLIKYDPYPVNPDTDFSIWVQIKNVGENDVSGATIEFIPTYPFSIKPGESAIRNPGTIRKNDEFVYKYTLHADKNAFVGTNTLEIGYRILENGFTKREFDIEIGTDIVDARGTVRLEKSALFPEVLMSGDSGTVTLSLKNSATEYTIKMDNKDYSMNAQIQSAQLMGNEFIEVTSDPYYNAGIIGPGDSIDLPFSIKIKNNTPDGTYFLDFNLKGAARLYSLNLKIPIRVDSSSIQSTLSETPKLNPGGIILSVANNRPNSLNAATVIPQGNATFEPAEYFIGTMDPDELFTVKFDILARKEENVGFKVRFKNGNNWHESETLVVKLNGSSPFQAGDAGKSSLVPIMIIFGTVIIIIVGFFIIMKRRRAKIA